ncbi:MAG: hypothetical protein EAZ53_14335 [Bacteroidetes bacterium]|nr:MAG: hypothetical protein EAZ53_14335 [Bacteroidota bacterium]
MKAESYKLSSDDSKLVFSFFSIGKRGIIPKVVVYEPIDDMVFNLAFGDFNIETKTLDDLIVSNNGDTRKVLSTVINTLYYFFENHPNALVLLKGSTELRTKLYQRIIKTYKSDFDNKFVITGMLSEVDKFKTIDFNENYVQFCIKAI